MEKYTTGVYKWKLNWIELNLEKQKWNFTVRRLIKRME